MSDKVEQPSSATSRTVSVSGVISTTKRGGLRARAKKYLRVFWYRAGIAARSPKWWLWNVTILGFWVALGWPVYQKGISRGLLHTALAMLALGGKAVRWASPRMLQIVERNYLERKARLYMLLREMQKQMYTKDPPTEEARLRFQRDALDLITSYVRGHRADHNGTIIFANLLVEDGDDIVVVARDKEHRVPLARYPKEGMIAWKAMQTGNTQICSDATKLLAPGREMSYRSILAIPIRNDERILGVVSIDSSLPYHFDLEVDALERALAPYVCLLGWTLHRVAHSIPSTQPSTAGGTP